MYTNFKGSSLIEVVVATALLAMLGVMLVTSINSSIRAKDMVSGISGRYQLAENAISRMAREISMAYLSKNIYTQEPAFITQFKGKSDSLFFSAFGNVVRQKDAKQSDEQVLGYYLAPNEHGQLSLMRRHKANLNLDVEKGGKALVLCPDVTKLTFSYYDDRFDRWEESWWADPLTLAVHDGHQKKEKDEKLNKASLPKPWRLPRLVKIELTVRMTDNTTKTWVSETEIPMREPLDLEPL
jgi:general secretion pathway protein J